MYSDSVIFLIFINTPRGKISFSKSICNGFGLNFFPSRQAFRGRIIASNKSIFNGIFLWKWEMANWILFFRYWALRHRMIPSSQGYSLAVVLGGKNYNHILFSSEILQEALQLPRILQIFFPWRSRFKKIRLPTIRTTSWK